MGRRVSFRGLLRAVVRRGRSSPSGAASSGQVLVIFAMALPLLIGMVALVIDVSWQRTNLLRAQRAADAAALAGVIRLPGDPTGASLEARAEALKNGYSHGVGGVVVTPTLDAANPLRLRVRVSAPVRTFFMGLFGISTYTVSREATAEFTPPVPMGSPQAYYGVDELRCLVNDDDDDGDDGDDVDDDDDDNGTRGCNSPVRAPRTRASLSAQGFWAALITRGGQRQNGDAYSPVSNGGSANADHDPGGYNYTVEFGAGTANGSVYLFDPTYCGVGPNPAGGWYGTGDHWIASDRNAVSTHFRLYRTNGTPTDETDDVLVAQSGTLFENERQTDQRQRGGIYEYGTPQITTGVPDCNNTPGGRWHNRWWRLANNLPAGSYRLNVSTTSALNSFTNAENLFSIFADANGGSSARVFGAGRMASYTNLPAGSSRFYLAQIGRAYAGKTMIIELFDPGDISGNGFLRILQPGGTAYSYATFSYTASNGRSGSNLTELQTAISGVSQFNNAWITIKISIPAGYGSGADDLIPVGETQAGWWKIEYQVAGGNDTTTWRVRLQGNPVHLIPS